MRENAFASCVCVSACVCACVNDCVCTCVSDCASSCVCTCVCGCVSVHVCVGEFFSCACVSVCVCACESACACVCERSSKTSWRQYHHQISKTQCGSKLTCQQSSVTTSTAAQLQHGESSSKTV